MYTVRAVMVVGLENNFPNRDLFPRKIKVKHNATRIFVSIVLKRLVWLMIQMIGN